jgi:hypothetical protein
MAAGANQIEMAFRRRIIARPSDCFRIAINAAIAHAAGTASR